MDMKVHKGDYENFDKEELHPEIEINLDRMNDASNRKGDFEFWNRYSMTYFESGFFSALSAYLFNL